MKKAICAALAAAFLFAAMGVTTFAAGCRLPSGVAYVDIESAIDGFVNDNKDTTAAVSVSVFTGDSVLLEKAYGHANVAAGTQADADTVFEWGSVTKLLVWISVMQLAEQRKLNLDRDIGGYLPKHFLRKLKYDDPITLLHLMNHTAGFQEIPLGLVVPFGTAGAGLGAALRLLEPAQVFRPGKHVAYSNYGAALAGYIVELVSGMPFYAYAREHIFAPLHMEQTALKPGLSDDGWVKSQRRKLNCYGADMRCMGAAMYDIPLYPAGMATGTIADLRRLAAALLPDQNGASPLFQKAETLTELFAPTSVFPDGKTPSNCHGLWFEPTMNGTVIGHLGATAGCISAVYIDPGAGVGMAVMTNQYGEAAYTRRLPRLIFGEKNLGSGGDFEEAGDLSGVYFMSRDVHKGLFKPMRFLRMVVAIKTGDGYRTFPETAIEPIGPALYVAEGLPLYAVFDERGRAVKLVSGTEEYMRSDAWYADMISLFATSYVWAATGTAHTRTTS